MPGRVKCGGTEGEIVVAHGRLPSSAHLIQQIETATYSKRRIFRETIFYIFEKLNNQCKVDIIFIKSFYLNGKTEFCEIILALLENFFIY